MLQAEVRGATALRAAMSVVGMLRPTIVAVARGGLAVDTKGGGVCGVLTKGGGSCREERALAYSHG